MPETMLAKALKEFELALDDLIANLEFVRAATRLRPRLGGMLHWPAMDNDAKGLANRFLEQRCAQESVVYRGLVVSLSGAFEQFVRRVVFDCVCAISEAGVGYDELDETLKKENIYRTGLALGTIYECPDYMELNYDALAKNIGTCFIGSKQVVLNAEAFTIFLSIVSPENLTKTLNRIGVDLHWDELGKVAPLQAILEKRKTRETAKGIQDYLKRFGQIRNKIAHTGSSGVVVTESDFEELVNFFRAFGSALVSLVELQLADHIRAKKP